MNALDEAVESIAQGAEFIIVLDGQAAGQVAFTVGNVLHGAGHQVQRLQQDADQHAEQGDDDHHRDDRGDHRRGAELTEHGERLVLVHRNAQVPVHRWQALDRCERHDIGLAIGLHFAEVAADLRRVFWINVRQGLHHQGFIGVHQHFAVGADQERIAHAAKIQRADVVHQGLQAQVAADYADALAALGTGRGNGDDQLPGRRVDIGFGQGRAITGLGALVPGANTRVEAVGHLGVRADGERALAVTDVGRHE